MSKVARGTGVLCHNFNTDIVCDITSYQKAAINIHTD